MTRQADDHYDLIVLGAGSGGYVSAIRAAQLGMTVGIVEERYWGGVCLNTGCVPSKALLRNAEIASIITDQSAAFGISGDVSLDYSRAVSRSREVAEARVRGVHFLMRKNNITEIDGHGRFTSPHSIHIDLRGGGSRLLSFDHAVIATGSRVRMLPGVAVSDNIVSYEQQILSAELPESIVIIGGGAIGMEFAYILHSYGVHVEILEFADRVLPNEDAVVSRELQRHYRRRGITIHTSTRVDKVIDHGEHVAVSHTSADGTSATAQAARAFICIGFCPNVEGIGLDSAGVRVGASGAIGIDDYMRTSAPHIYAWA
jgi:dihydrolipoyl dehydrogenase